MEIWCVCQAVLRFAGAVDERISSKSNGIGRVLDPVKRTHNKFWKIFVLCNDTNRLGRKWMKMSQRKRKPGGNGIRRGRSVFHSTEQDI